MKDLLQTLVAMQTITSDKAANRKALDFVANFLRQRGMHIAWHEWSGFSSFVATTRKNTLNPTILFVAHLDVIPASKQDFALIEQENRFFGRGTFDMKFAIAAYMQLVDELQYDLQNYDFGIMLTTDEEAANSGIYGTKKLVEHSYAPKVAIVPDGGDNWQIETFAKGFWRATIEVTGKSAHSSRPWEGDSASFKLVDLLTHVKKLFAGHGPMTDTLNIGIIEGGEAVSQIPASARAKLDIRYMSYDSLDKKVQAIEDLCKKYDAIITGKNIGAVCNNQLSNPFISAFADSITNITGHQAGQTMSYGASDARYFAEVGIPCIIVRPPRPARMDRNQRFLPI